MMNRRRLVFVHLLATATLSPISAEVLFGPVTVMGGQTHTETFPMYCRCTAYFLEVANQGADSCVVLLNGAEALRMGESDRVYSKQVELREDGPDKIKIRAMGPEAGSVTVQVYERELVPCTSLTPREEPLPPPLAASVSRL